MGTFGTWNPYTSYVNGGGVADGRFVSGGLTLIAAGPPRLAELGAETLASELTSGETDIVYPIAAIQNVNMSQNKTFMRVWELGSERSYFIGSRTVGQVALSRVYYHGPSLLRCMYAYYQDEIGPVQVPWVFPNPGAYSVANPHDVNIVPGYENLFINLASDMFNQPIGLMMYMRDSNLDTVGAIYLESVVIPSHTWATDAQGTIVQESVALQYERIVPVAVTSLALITGSEEAA
jgi:hypothetical protein